MASGPLSRRPDAYHFSCNCVFLPAGGAERETQDYQSPCSSASHQQVALRGRAERQRSRQRIEPAMRRGRRKRVAGTRRTPSAARPREPELPGGGRAGRLAPATPPRRGTAPEQGWSAREVDPPGPEDAPAQTGPARLPRQTPPVPRESRTHNNLRITRILKCLGEMGLGHLQAPLVRFFLEETLCNDYLPNVGRSVLDYFMFIVKDKQERRKLVWYAWKNYKSQEPFIWGPVEKLRSYKDGDWTGS